MQLSLCRVGVAEERDVLTSTDLCARFTIGDDTHALDTLGNAHLRIEYTTVSREIHATDIVGGERYVLQLNPCLTLPELIHNAGGIVGQYLIETDVLGSLSHHP